MAVFDLRIEIVAETLRYPIARSKYANQASEQRRLLANKEITGFRFDAPNATKEQMQLYRDFYKARKGELESFTYVSPFDDIAYTCRFDGAIESKFEGGVFKVSFVFVVTDWPESG